MYTVTVLDNVGGAQIITGEPRQEPIIMQGNDELLAQIKEYRKLKAKNDREAKILDIMKKTITTMMGDHSSVVDNDGVEVCTYNTSKPVSRFDTEAFKEHNKALYDKYCKLGAPIRTFRLK